MELLLAEVHWAKAEDGTAAGTDFSSQNRTRVIAIIAK